MLVCYSWQIGVLLSSCIYDVELSTLSTAAKIFPLTSRRSLLQCSRSLFPVGLLRLRTRKRVTSACIPRNVPVCLRVAVEDAWEYFFFGTFFFGSFLSSYYLKLTQVFFNGY
jgi:hypothetical protein